MKKVLLTTTFLVSLATFAQAPTFNWAKSITNGSSIVNDITTDNAGNVYTTGSSTGSANIGPNDGTLAQVIYDNNPNAATFRNVFITKMSASGSIIWTKTFGGTYDDSGNAIKVDSDGNVFVAGTFKGDVDFNPDVAEYYLNSGSVFDNSGINSFIVKFGPTGNFLFAKAFVGTYNQEMNDLDIDAQGNLYTTGTFLGFSALPTDFDPGFGTFNITALTNDVFVVKLENDGDFVWAKSFSGGESNVTNIEDKDKGNAIKVDSNGNIFVAGTFSETVDFDPSASVSNLTAIGSRDAFIVKLTSAGNLIWAKKIGGTSSDIGKSMDLDSSGNIYLLGYYSETYDGTVTDFNPNAGVVNLLIQNNIQNAVVKLNSAGDFMWAKRFRGNGRGPQKAFDVDQNGNVFVTDQFSGTVNTPVTYDFDEGSGVFNLTISSNGNYVSVINTDGNFVTAYRTGDAFTDLFSTAFCASATGELYCAGNYFDTIDFDPTAGVFTLAGSGESSFLQKMSYQTLGIQGNNILSLKLYPNPTTSNLGIQMQNALENATLKIISITSQTVLEKENLSGTDFNFDVSTLNQGIYIVQLKNGTEVFNSKFIKQ